MDSTGAVECSSAIVPDCAESGCPACKESLQRKFSSITLLGHHLAAHAALSANGKPTRHTLSSATDVDLLTSEPGSLEVSMTVAGSTGTQLSCLTGFKLNLDIKSLKESPAFLPTSLDILAQRLEALPESGAAPMKAMSVTPGECGAAVASPALQVVCTGESVRAVLTATCCKIVMGGEQTAALLFGGKIAVPLRPDVSHKLRVGLRACNSAPVTQTEVMVPSAALDSLPLVEMKEDDLI
eukprot:CAMPEP_0177674914 /NCGR_PEP_ID=MMETSP0447-20121125/26870_1 /TAXON_ID=0 /ORGANISM="Stygamoeba regulata, Strain BSH-02190019" /LENGTH=239 /DNA_ID=CAMNT_0019183163 /DNA_START=104 /DNA_END=823 /DNA_ORIENTATION=+